MLFIAFILAVVLTAIAYYKRHNLILWVGVAIAWGSLAREWAGELLRQASLWLFGA
ncbi:hypothetical protein ACTHR6_24860 [Ralstonia holmesii]|uniref:hypothetical protein n=1 Tax=Ralstonia TaxID=48736 RepID=UPI000B12D9BB|nr:hypothetical protein [Ralstonia pickettii]